jgi:hypothetical protein
MSSQNIRICVMLLAASPTFVGAQWLNHATPGIPRTSDGKPNLTAKAPRAADGHPDLSGQWQAQAAPRDVLARLLPGGNGDGGEAPSQYFLNLMEGLKPGESPLLPAAEASYRKITQDFTKASPVSHCLPTGIPLVEYSPAPFKIVQTPGLIVMIYERDTTFRQVYTDGRALPKDPSPMWMGYSVGKWDGDALIVETGGLTDRSWLDVRGHTHSEALHLTERFQRADFGHMDEQITFDDPKTFTRPFTIKVQQRLQADTDLLESFCSENERDMVHINQK